MKPEQLFFEAHEPRNVNSALPNPPIIGGSNTIGPVSKNIKNIIGLNGSTCAYEFLIPNNELIEISMPIGYGELICVSKRQDILFFSTKQNMCLTSYNLTTKEIKSEFRAPSIITTAISVSGRLLIIGGRDCSVRVWDLYTRKKIQILDFMRVILRQLALVMITVYLFLLIKILYLYLKH